MKAFVFPGQGSQKLGMGNDLFDKYPDLTKQADDILGYSIKELCLEDPNNHLNFTEYTQPAIFFVSYLQYLEEIRNNNKPDYLAGHSLGEYTALCASEVFDFKTGLNIVRERGRLMSMVKNGSMAAVIGISNDEIRNILKINSLAGIDIANYNAPGQTVLSGAIEEIQIAKDIFEKAGASMYIILKVSGAFHSRYMEDVKNSFKAFIDPIKFSELKIPIISNVTAKPYKNNEIKSLMLDQITNSVQWTDSIRILMGMGVTDFIEIGPGNVLTKLIDKIKKESTPIVNFNKDLSSNRKVLAENLGCAEYRKDYNIKYSYVTGAMFRGVASKELVVKMGKSGLMGFLGTGGLPLNVIEDNIKYIQSNLNNNESYGMNLLCNINDPALEEKTVQLFLNYKIKNIEAAAYMKITPALVLYRLSGLKKNNNDIIIENKIQAKISRPEVAELFMSPAPEKMVTKLLKENKISVEQAELSKNVPLADDICVEADSGGHTDMGVASNLVPAIIKLRDRVMSEFKYNKKIRVGAAGGIGTPEAAASSFMLGADFIVTGSINQCTVEAGTSDEVKALLENINVQDTEYAPAGDMFEVGAKVQVLKKGVFFPARANKLYELYKQYNSIDDIDEKTRIQIEQKYFKKSFNEVYEETKKYFLERNPSEIEKAEKNPKHKMALIFRWYFSYSSRLALLGDTTNKIDYQVHCGPSLGAFNQWVKGTDLEKWQNRNVDIIADKLMTETASYINNKLNEFF